MTEEELFGLTADEKRREHIQRPPVEVKKGVGEWEYAVIDENDFYDDHHYFPPSVEVKVEIVQSVATMQMRAGALFSDMIGGKIAGYRVDMDRSVYPTEFHITTWR